MLLTRNEWHDWDMIAMKKTVLHVYVYESRVRGPMTPFSLPKWCFIVEIPEMCVEGVFACEKKRVQW